MWSKRLLCGFLLWLDTSAFIYGNKGEQHTSFSELSPLIMFQLLPKRNSNNLLGADRQITNPPANRRRRRPQQGNRKRDLVPVVRTSRNANITMISFINCVTFPPPPSARLIPSLGPRSASRCKRTVREVTRVRAPCLGTPIDPSRIRPFALFWGNSGEMAISRLSIAKFLELVSAGCVCVAIGVIFGRLGSSTWLWFFVQKALGPWTEQITVICTLSECKHENERSLFVHVCSADFVKKGRIR